MTTPRFTHAQTDHATDELNLILLSFSHEDLTQLGLENPSLGVENGTLNFVNYDRDIVSNGVTYKAYPFSWTDPEQGDNSRSVARLRIDNIDQRIVQVLRSISGEIRVRAQLVLASDPDTVEREYPAFVVPFADWNILSVGADLTTRTGENEPVSAWTLNPRFSPALF